MQRNWMDQQNKELSQMPSKSVTVAVYLLSLDEFSHENVMGKWHKGGRPLGSNLTGNHFQGHRSAMLDLLKSDSSCHGSKEERLLERHTRKLGRSRIFRPQCIWGAWGNRTAATNQSRDKIQQGWNCHPV